MARYTPDKAYIASIYPGKLEPIRRNYGPSLHSSGKGAERSSLFDLKPVKRGEKPYILELTDCFEEVIDLNAIRGAQDGRVARATAPKPVPVEQIREDLLRVWTGGLFAAGDTPIPAEAKPGIIGIVGTVPTQAELNQLKTQQTLYFEILFTVGERLHKQSNWKEITDTMRLAADWLGYDREWSNRAIARNSAPCPFCQTIIPETALVCAHCGKTVRAIPKDLAELQSASA